MTQEILKYQELGFTGFIKVKELHIASPIPPCNGVYIVVRDSHTPPQFLYKGMAGFFKEKDPNVPIETLEQKYVASSQVVYIGKAKNLRKRISELIRFGNGAKVGHWGGRFLWQLADAQDLLIAWCPCSFPRETERCLLTAFEEAHGALPFANLQK